VGCECEGNAVGVENAVGCGFVGNLVGSGCVGNVVGMCSVSVDGDMVWWRPWCVGNGVGIKMCIGCCTCLVGTPVVGGLVWVGKGVGSSPCTGWCGSVGF
jgi:hypothetical protein